MSRALVSIAATLGVAAMLWAFSPSRADAHAYIVDTQPAADGSYENPLGTIAIGFDEPIDILDADAIEVDDAHGTRIDRHDAAIDPQDATRVVVHVPRVLVPGAYTVHWRVVSADTHVVHGSYRIGVGVAVTSSGSTETASPFDPSAPLASLLRWLSLIGAVVAVGALGLNRFMLQRLEGGFPGLQRSAELITVAGASLVLAAAIPSALIQAASAGNLRSDLLPTIVRTTWGHAFLVRVLGGIVLLGAATLRRSVRPFAMPLAAIALILSFSTAGHALAQPTALARTVAIVADALHVAAASFWVGGVIGLAIILLPRLRRGEARAGELARSLFVNFTPLAMVCVAAIVATGIYASAIHLGSAANLIASTYGRVLVAKILVVVALLALGYRHLRMSTRADTRAFYSIAIEATAGFAVVLLTAFLIGQMPPAGMPPAGMPPMPGM